MADSTQDTLLPFLEPGEYPVVWLMQGETDEVEIGGFIALNRDRAVTGWASGDEVLDWTAFSNNWLLGNIVRRPVIVGRLDNGLFVSMLNAEVRPFVNRLDIRGSAALVGRSRLSDLPAVEELSIQIEGIDLLLERSEQDVWMKGDAHANDASHSAIFSIESYASPPDHGSFQRTPTTPILRLVSKARPWSVQDAIEGWVEPIRRIVSLVTGRRENITLLRFWIDPNPASVPADLKRFDVFGQALTQEIYAPRTYDPQQRKVALVFGSEGEPSIARMHELWLADEQAGHPLVATYGEAMYVRELHPRSRFLLNIQALEGFYGREFAAGRSDAEVEHMRQRVSAVATIAKLAMPEDQKAFIASNLPKHPRENLKVALAEVLPSVISADLLQTSLISRLMANGKADSEFDGLRLVRNHLSHGEETYKREELGEIAAVLDRAIRGLLVKRLGGSPRAVQRAMSPN